jgi:MFS family permease
MTSTKLSTRTPGAVQGWTLASANWLSVIATSAITPVLGMIAVHFANTPNLDVKLGLVSTIPALFVAICAWPAGWLADKIGLRPVLLVAVGLYGFAGCAPMVLDNMTGIVISRAGVGILEAAIMTVTTALVGDYFHGNDRERWLAVQTGGASVIATVTVVLCGMLGDAKGLPIEGWRLPFAMYGFGFILFFLCLFKIWEPTSAERSAVQASEAAQKKSEGTTVEAGSFSMWSVVPIYVITFFAATAFYVLLIQLAFILGSRGFSVGATIGTVMAFMSVCMALGAVIFKYLKVPVAGKLTLSFLLSGSGFAVVALSGSVMGITIGSMITGFGSGMALPTLITWVMSKLPASMRARGMGFWQATFFVGQFASPQIIIILKNNFGGINGALFCYSGFMGVAAVLAIICLIKGGFSKNTPEIA